MNLIAITAIERVVKPGRDATATQRRIKPEIESIPAGKAFSVSEDEGKDLIGRGAARLDKSAKAAKTAKTNTKTDEAAAAEQQAAKEAAEREAAAKAAGEQKAVDDMTKDEIKAELDSRKIEYDGRSSKDDLAKALTAAREGGEEDDEENMV